MINGKKKIRELEKRIEELEKEIEILKLQKSYPDNTKPIPLPMPTYPTPSYKPTCSVCGLVFDGPMGYVCTRPDCPSGVVYC